LVAFLGIQQNITSQINQAVSQQDEVSNRVAIQVGEYIRSAENELKTLTEVHNIQGLSIEEQRKTLINLLSFSEVYSEISLTNPAGREVVKVSRDELLEALDLKNIKLNPAFSEPMRTGQTYYGDVTFDKETGLPFMYLGLPIIDLASGHITGVLVANLRFQAVWSFMSKAAQEERSVYMTDVNGRIVAHSNPSVALKGLTFISSEEDMLADGLNGTASILGHATIPLTEEKSFTVITELPWQDALVTSIRFMEISLGLILLTVGIIYLVSIRLTRSLTGPIEALARTAGSIQGGDLSARVDIESDDEIGLLGDAFNEMAGQLQEVLAGLEIRVEERTLELEKSLGENQQRADQLEAIAVAARTIATLDDVDELLPNIAELVSERFNFYHVGIFLLDAEEKFAILRAANSDGGKAMIARAHKLRIGKEGVVGYTVAHKQARIALDVGGDAVFFDNPELPNTHSEMALPLMLGSNVIGVLDIQSEEIGAFTEDDIEVLSTLADQIAVAIENARLFAQSRETLEELERTFQQYVRSEWKRFVEVSNVKGFVAQQAGVQPISTKTSLQKDDKAEKSDTTYKVPVKLRDVVIGHINVDLDKPISEYTADELDLIHAAVERFTLALENARLLETTTRRARRERLVSEVTTKIRSTNNPDEMVKTAMEELKKILGASKVDLQAYQPDDAVTEPSKDE